MWMYFCFAIKISKLEHGEEKAPRQEQFLFLERAVSISGTLLECQNTFISIFRWGTPKTNRCLGTV
jgi:hypothetical protein